MMKQFMAVSVCLLVFFVSGCRKEKTESYTDISLQRKAGITFYNTESNAVEYHNGAALEKGKPPVNNSCPSPVGTAVQRIAINGNNAQYQLWAYVYNSGSNWLLWEVSGQGGNESGVVRINTDDGSDGVPQTIDMGTFYYPKDACFTIKISGYLKRPNKTRESCSPPAVSGLICPELFPPL